MTTPAAPPSSSPPEGVTLAAPDPDAVVPVLDLKEYPKLDIREQQATGYERGPKLAELKAREAVHQLIDRLNADAARLAALKTTMGAGLSESDVRFESFMASRSPSAPVAFEELERLNRIRSVRQAHHEATALRERNATRKGQIPALLAEVQRARAELAREAEREAARKKLAENHLGPKWGGP